MSAKVMARQKPIDGLANARTVRPGGMSYWRWLLFAAMVRIELREDVFLALPNATTMPREVRFGMESDELRRW